MCRGRGCSRAPPSSGRHTQLVEALRSPRLCRGSDGPTPQQGRDADEQVVHGLFAALGIFGVGQPTEELSRCGVTSLDRVETSSEGEEAGGKGTRVIGGITTIYYQETEGRDLDRYPHRNTRWSGMQLAVQRGCLVADERTCASVAPDVSSAVERVPQASDEGVIAWHGGRIDRARLYPWLAAEMALVAPRPAWSSWAVLRAEDRDALFRLSDCRPGGLSAQQNPSTRRRHARTDVAGQARRSGHRRS